MSHFLRRLALYVIGIPTPITGWVIFGSSRVPLVPGFRVRLDACPGWLSALPDAPLSDKDLLVPVGADVAIAFDVEPTGTADEVPAAGTNSLSEITLQISMPAAKIPIGSVKVIPIWPLPPLHPEVEELLPGQNSDADLFLDQWGAWAGSGPCLPPARHEGAAHGPWHDDRVCRAGKHLAVGSGFHG